ncbi:cytochrome c oxidase assembly protein [Melghirimyces algeriensis]|uniref:Putative membrane protein n=1 Tax=Melghirimyces algeriensis TaxID=910412 RepID=A0A521C150_9BACL|nr:cytochrome c oxidase assembly protein [Melghirimyces algeriensis]SMO53114.1 putative membrane protein [Melghirimyces algeriensis]
MDTIIEMFLYPSNWNIELNLLVLLIACAYLAVVSPFRRRFKEGQPVPVRQISMFLTALMIYYFALGSPLDAIGHELFSMHMLQMTLLYIVMPPILLAGLPSWMVRPFVNWKPVRALIQFLIRPFISMFLFNGMLSLYHLPWVFNQIMESDLLHVVTHVLLMVTALSMWWSIICPVPEMNRLSELKKMGFLYANGMLLTPVCALVIFANEPMYALFMETSELFPVMTPLNDQQTGGVIMKIVQEIVYIAVIGYIFFHWVRKEREKDRAETEGESSAETIYPAPDSV